MRNRQNILAMGNNELKHIVRCIPYRRYWYHVRFLEQSDGKCKLVLVISVVANYLAGCQSYSRSN